MRVILKISAIPSGALMRKATVIVLCAFALTGCTTVRGWFGGKADKPSEPAALVEFAPTASPARVWTANVGKGEGRLGARQGPAVADGRVYAAAVAGGVRAFDLQSGASVWHFPSRLRLSGGPGAGDGLVVVGGLDGDVIALDATSGAERWTAKVNNEVIAAPAIGQGLVLVRSNDGRVTAFDAQTGQRRWFWNHDLPSLTVRGNDAPLLAPGVVFVGNDDGTIAALALADGRPLWEQAVAQPDGRTELDRMADIDGTPALDGTTLYASSFKRRTMAIDGPSGQPIWVSDSGGAGRVGVAADRVVVSDPAGTVWALDKASGSAYWQQDKLARRGLGSAVVHGDYVAVGDFDGYLHWLRLDTGEFAARSRVGRSPIRASPVVVDGILLVQDSEGGVSAWRVQ